MEVWENGFGLLGKEDQKWIRNNTLKLVSSKNFNRFHNIVMENPIALNDYESLLKEGSLGTLYRRYLFIGHVDYNFFEKNNAEVKEIFTNVLFLVRKSNKLASNEIKKDEITNVCNGNVRFEELKKIFWKWEFSKYNAYTIYACPYMKIDTEKKEGSYPAKYGAYLKVANWYNLENVKTALKEYLNKQYNYYMEKANSFKNLMED